MKPLQIVGIGLLAVLVVSNTPPPSSFPGTVTSFPGTEPSEEIKSLVQPVFTLLTQGLSVGQKEKCKAVRDFYFVFSDVVKRDEAEVISTSAKFRKYNQITTRLAFKDVYDSTPGLNEAIDEALKTVISTNPNDELDYMEVSKVLEGISWAAQMAMEE